jgi:hypothetical protein
MQDFPADVVNYRRALEALRNGVPNRDAVKVMGCAQAAAEARFREQLAALDGSLERNKQVPGLLVTADFGNGKSHLLEYFEHLALSENFVCSRVVISKETPLYDPVKVYRSAIESAVVPGVTGQAIQEIALKFQENSSQYARFYQWCNSLQAQISPIFPATLLLHERLRGDPEMVEKIVGFWSGERLPASEVRKGLKRVNGLALYNLKAIPRLRELALQRFIFTPRLMIGAGYRGWVILLDELELIGHYSLLQRARSYAELARWMGRLESEQYPGLAIVGAITDDFDARVLGEKGDSDSIREKLEAKGTEEFKLLAACAETGMRTIRRDGFSLEPPDEDSLRQTYERLKQVHGCAHTWEPPEIAPAERSITRRMRSHVRRWINEWDLRRLYPGVDISTEERELRPSYSEDAEIEQPLATEEDD